MSETLNERNLVDAVNALLDENPVRLLPVLSQALEARGVRSVMVALGVGRGPQTAISMTVDDVTAETTRLVAMPFLRRMGLEENVAQLMATGAATAAARWVSNYRIQQRQRAANAQAAQAQAGQGWGQGAGAPANQAADGGDNVAESDAHPKWTPGPQRD